MPEEIDIVSGEAERVGTKGTAPGLITHIIKENKRFITKVLPNHIEAFKEVLTLIYEDSEKFKDVNFETIAYRYVNSGIYLTGTTKILKKDLKKLQDSFDIAPLHNPIIFELIKFSINKFPESEHFVVADNSFHRTIPKEYSTYAIPLNLIKKFKIKRMGYHGISHQYVMQEASKFLNIDSKYQKIISCHLGTGGSSICAIKHGKSVNSSMGFTPLEGLLMNTRSGDIDIGMFFYIMYKNNLNTVEAENILNKKSGVLGILKESSDLRDALKKQDKSSGAKLALDMYIRRIKKYIGNYFIQLKKIDFLIFTDTLGVTMPEIRNTVCDGLECFGIRIDKKLNNSYHSGIADISHENSKVKILVVPTNEELMIAREAYKELSICVEL